VASFGATTIQSTTDVRGSTGILLPDVPGTETYSVAANGQLTFSTGNQGVVGYVASACEIEAIFEGDNSVPIIGTFECQQATASGPTLTVTEAGTGTGTVTSSPAGITCPTTCAASFTGGSQVVLTATPTGGSTFTSFSANCTPANPQTNPPTCTVPIATAPVAVTATFTAGAILPSLEITKTHAGNFTQGQQGATYTVTVSNGAGKGPTTGVVTVTDTVPAGLTLVSMAGTNWTCVASSCTRSDALAGGTSYPVITVTVNVAANASSPQVNQASVSGGGSIAPPAALDSTVITPSSGVSLTVTEAGTGGGTVTSGPAGINCPTTCAANFASGTAVTLTAAPNASSTFAGWGGTLCEGTGTCTFTITANAAVTANFTAKNNTFALTVTDAGTGAGTVTSVPAGIICPETCSANFTSGAAVALTAVAAEGSTFAGWSGAGCTGTGGCSVTMTAAEAVTATFNSGNSPVTISVAPGSPSTVNTTPGGSAVFGLALTALPGTTGTVQLGCASPSPNITCKIVPSSIVLTGKAIDVAIVVETFCQGEVPDFGPIPGGLTGGLGVLLAAMALCGMMWTFKQRPRWALSFAVLIFMAVGMSACASLPKSPGGAATPPGSYPLVVTATAPNGAPSSVNLTLVVQ
jgi:uncharacterized repeat protein (TIGR01451 family)